MFLPLSLDKSLRGGLKTFRNEVLDKPRESSKLLIPAVLYTVQNNLLFLALSNLDAGTYQVIDIAPLIGIVLT